MNYESKVPLPPCGRLYEETTALVIAQAQIAMGTWLALMLKKDRRKYDMSVAGVVQSINDADRVYVLTCKLVETKE